MSPALRPTHRQKILHDAMVDPYRLRVRSMAALRRCMLRRCMHWRGECDGTAESHDASRLYGVLKTLTSPTEHRTNRFET